MVKTKLLGGFLALFGWLVLFFFFFFNVFNLIRTLFRRIHHDFDIFILNNLQKNAFQVNIKFLAPLLKSIYLFIYLAVSGLSCGEQAFVTAHGPLSSCRAWAPERAGSVVAVHGLQNPRAQLPRSKWDLSSPTRARTRIPCIGRQILNHWIAREVPLGTS